MIPLSITSFMNNLLSSLYEWIITELPGILILIVATLIVLKVYKTFVKKLRNIIIKRSGKKESWSSKLCTKPNQVENFR